jgi:dUTP pyrophosphatase
MALEVELKILDPRLAGWGFPRWGSDLAAGLDLHACLDAPLILRPQHEAVLVSSGIAIRIADADWCAMVYPRSGLGHKRGLVLGNSVGVIDADYEGTCFISVWNRNPARLRGVEDEIVIQPGERIAQLVFTRIVRPHFKVVAEFSQRSKRDSGGFGSTGT